eukprot:TRINITY_DN556_c0_g1_i1.p1 TRINITY_DN556_c0_g1~~TRINITY_DN556_c0_g1_i1.p1  ORF type:complete len:132 (-),score=21.96 TRINITY_DN556_c0_g1_i1:153-548(-)
MGNVYMRMWHDGPEVTPKCNSKPTFDPMLGFENGRKPRVLSASAEEMEAVQLPHSQMGYCGREMVDAKICRWKYPWILNYKCHHENHAVEMCLQEDYVFRMKEWERERRLRIRQKKIDEANAAAAAEELDD